MTRRGRRGRLSPDVAAARRAVLEAVAEALGRPPQPQDLVLVGLSGGPDSLALAAAAAHWARRGDLRAGAVVVDHGLQPGSGRVAQRAAAQARELGLDPVLIRAVEVRDTGEGPEAAARSARYAALHQACREHGAAAVLLGHTLDDQAESVLLGLARGSGTRSLSGMARQRLADGVLHLRPLLVLRRAQTEAVCSAEQLEPWHDPTNQDESLLRARVRATVLPFLERELGPGIAQSLARTAAILGPDAELLEEQAARVLERALLGAVVVGEPVRLSLDVLQEAPSPLSRRALARACLLAGAQAPVHERLTALAELAAGRGEAGPVQLAGRVAAYRRRPRGREHGAGTLELLAQPGPSAPAPRPAPTGGRTRGAGATAAGQDCGQGEL